MSYKITALSYFRKKIKKLKKKYPQIKEDLIDLLPVLKENPQAGEKPPGTNIPLYKIRMGSRDQKRGKSGGFRIIYFFRGKDGQIYLITIYPKSVQENFDLKKIIEILKEEGLI